MLTRIINILKEQLYPISLYSRQIAGTIVLLLVTRMLSVHDYGLMRSYVAIVSFWLMFANLGYNEYILVSSKNVVREVQLKIGLFIINAILIMFLIGFGGMLSPLESKLIFILVLIRTFFDGTFFGIMLPYYQASHRFNLISWINIFYSVMTIIIALVSFLLHLSLAKFLFLGIILGLFNFLQCSFYAKINYFLVFRHLKDIFSKLDKSIFAYSGVSICYYLYNQLPSVYSSLFVSKEDAALFFSAFAIAGIIGLLISAQVQKIVPEMINASKDKIKSIINSNMKFILTINTVILVFFVFFGKFLLNLLYGKAYYMQAYPMLLILTFSNISIAIAAIYGAYITASGNQKMKIQMQAEAIVITVVSLLLFFKLGIYAATIAYLLSATHIGVRYIIKTRQILKTIE
ncbi:hypothetical protein IKQ26_04475 [bacterium]|nr:hypothetical protein [bacterium]